MKGYCVQATKFGNRMNERILFAVTWSGARIALWWKFLPRGRMGDRLTIGEVRRWKWKVGPIDGYHETGDVIWARGRVKG